jgi:hypothetical protein
MRLIHSRQARCGVMAGGYDDDVFLSHFPFQIMVRLSVSKRTIETDLSFALQSGVTADVTLAVQRKDKG